MNLVNDITARTFMRLTCVHFEPTAEMTPFLFVKITDIGGLELTWTSFGVPSTTSSLFPTMTLTMFCCSLMQTLPILVQNLRIDLVTTAPMNVPGSILLILPGLVYCLVETCGWNHIWSSSWIKFHQGLEAEESMDFLQYFQKSQIEFEDFYVKRHLFVYVASCDATCHQTCHLEKHENWKIWLKYDYFFTICILF